MKLDGNNRILVAQGLARIRAGKASPGIAALLSVAGRDARRVAAGDLAFSVGPRLNAAGRLEDMSTGIECLLARDHGRWIDENEPQHALSGQSAAVRGHQSIFEQLAAMSTAVRARLKAESLKKK